MQHDQRKSGILTWLAVAVPGIFAGITWAATESWPLANRVLTGVAVGLAIYAAIHLAFKGMKSD